MKFQLLSYKSKIITEQINRLCQLIPSIGRADEKLAEQPLPQGAESYFAILRWQTLAPTYGEALQKVLDLIKETLGGKFYNLCEGQFGPRYLRQYYKTVNAFAKLGNQQKGYDILVVPCQFGLHYNRLSVLGIREAMDDYEFGLGAFAVACMLLTHPERLQHYDDLWIDCSGDEYSGGGSNRFERAPYFNFKYGNIRFDTRWFGDDRERFGAASGFFRQ